MELFDEAVAGGAARYKAAELIDMSERTLKRWRGANGTVAEDLRPEAERAEQLHQLTQAEEVAILSACNQPEYRSAYSRPRLPLIPDEACQPFHAKAATDSTAKLPPRQAA